MDFRTCHRTTFWLLLRRMALGSCKSSVKCQSQSLSYEFYWTQLRATLICDAGRLVTCWSETGREGGGSECEKAVVLATMNNTCTCSLGSSRQQAGIWAQCSNVPHSATAPKFVMLL